MPASDQIESHVSVRHEAARERYVLAVDGRDVGLLAYRPVEAGLALLHAEVLPGYGGRGLGSRLVEAALADIRTRGLRVLPLCPFVAAYIDRNPGERDLVAT